VKFSVDRVHKSFGSLSVLKNISFSVENGEIVSLIGPSGSGKTTLLKILASLTEADSGTVGFEYKPDLNHPVILVFQDYMLFPHMSIFENIAYGLKARKMKKEEIESRVLEMAEAFGIADKLQSYPAELSGGQKQRVSIARALVIRPALLLLDEPFANLDRNLKTETARFIKQSLKKFGTTCVTVTHDLEEAFVMSDKIGILLDGLLHQFASVETIYEQPASVESAKFLGPVNIIPKKYFNLLNINTVKAEDIESSAEFLFCRAEDVRLEENPEGQGIIQDLCFLGKTVLYEVTIDDLSLKALGIGNQLQKNMRVAVHTKLHRA
jgi:putative spermidine/putrescine transport system ATP-binding protein